MPGAVHPLVIRHPATDRRALYLGRRRNAHIPGLSLEEGERKLDALWAHATKPELTWYQEWRVGDVVMWDNCSTMDRRDAFDPSTRRLLRGQVAGVADTCLYPEHAGERGHARASGRRKLHARPGSAAACSHGAGR